MSFPAGVKRRLRQALFVAALAGSTSLAAAALPPPQTDMANGAHIAQVVPGNSDKSLDALHDELQRSAERLVLPGQPRPYYIQYRLLDLDERTITAQFGALISSTRRTNRFMSVDVRVGNYMLDSSNFLSGRGFRGFLGSTGTVGIDRDYNSLRQDLWLATDQAYKEALDALSQKKAVLRDLANAPTVPDFSQVPPMVLVKPRLQPDWTSRDWEAEAKAVSAVLRKYPQLYDSSVTYHLIYATTYLMTTEGTEIRVSRSFAAIEAGMNTQADDGMPLHNYLAIYADSPAQLPADKAVEQQLDRAGSQLVALRTAPRVKDYDGPILFEPHAAAALIAQLLGPSLGGDRPILTTSSRFDQFMQALGGRNEWTGRIGQRVLPPDVNLIDDPTVKQFQGQDLIGSYDVDQEGVRAQRVALVENGMLRHLLMSRRPGPDFQNSNGHGRSTFLADPRPMMSNLFFVPSNGQSEAALRKKFLQACKENGLSYGLIVRRMDNPVIASSSQEELSDSLAAAASGAPVGDRLPLLVYRVNLNTGQEELVRGAILSGMTARSLRNLLGVGNDPTVFAFEQGQGLQFAGTALGAFGSADGGVPSDVIAPSLLFEEVEVRGPHGEPQRMPMVPPPPMR